MAMFVRAASQFSPLFKEKNYMFVPKKMEILQENTKMMNRYCFSLNNILHFKLCHFTNFMMLFLAVSIDFALLPNIKI